MRETRVLAPSEVAEERQQEAHAPYLRVWLALAILTAIEYLYASWFSGIFVVLVLGLLLWAALKAGLVGWYFMHLKFEGKWVYLLIVPALLMATILVLALLPDQLFPYDDESLDGAVPSAPAESKPAEPGPRAPRTSATALPRPSGLAG